MSRFNLDDIRRSNPALAKRIEGAIAVRNETFRTDAQNARDAKDAEKPLSDEKPKGEASMNKTERMFFMMLLADWCGRGFVKPQATRFFPLKGGGTYTPDFMVFPDDGSHVRIYEVKGGYRGPGWDQGYERYKRTALQYDGDIFDFYMATYNRKKREWTIEKWKEIEEK